MRSNFCKISFEIDRRPGKIFFPSFLKAFRNPRFNQLVNSKSRKEFFGEKCQGSLALVSRYTPRESPISLHEATSNLTLFSVFTLPDLSILISRSESHHLFSPFPSSCMQPTRYRSEARKRGIKSQKSSKVSRRQSYSFPFFSTCKTKNIDIANNKQS